VGKHETGFARVERDFYPTPAWVIEALAEHVDLVGLRVWEPACGDGRMSEALKAAGSSVQSSDIQNYGYVGLDAVVDFVNGQHPDIRFNAIITNHRRSATEANSPSDLSRSVCSGLPTAVLWRCCCRWILIQQKPECASSPAARTSPARSS
jgi:hypothetical protein